MSTLASPAGAGATPTAVSLRTWVAVGASLLGAFMAVLDIQITNASLRDILGTLSATQSEGSWVSSSYLVAEIIVIPLAGFLASVFSTRGYMMATTLLFLVFSTLCGQAWSLESMIVFRAAQGFTGGAMIPMAMTLVMRKLPLAQRPLGLALFGMTATFAPTVGPTVGGWLAELFGWPMIFYVNWLPGLVLIAGVGWGLEREPLRLAALKDVDWTGIAAMAVGLGSLTAMLEEGNSRDWFEADFIRVTAALALGGIVLWVWRSLTRPNSVVDLRVFTRPSFLIACVIAFTSGMGLYGSAFLLPLFLSQIAGYSPMQIGFVLMWVGLPQLFILPFAAKLSTRIDNRLMISAGLALFAGSCFMNAFMTAETAGPELIVAQIVRALGQPLVMTAVSNFATQGVPAALMASSSGMYNMTRNLGGSVGIAVLATLLATRQQLHSAGIGEAVTLYDAATQTRLEQLAQNFIAGGAEPSAAPEMALRALDNVVRRESFVMAYNDAFLVLGAALLACIAVVWLGRRVVGGEAGAS